MSHFAPLDDLRSAWRALRKAPVLSLAAMITLGVGVGAGITVYAWARSLLLQPFPGVADGVGVHALYLETSEGDAISLSVTELRELGEALSGQVAVAGHDLRAVGFARGSQTPERVFAEVVSGNYFEVLGVRPHLGRLLEAEDDRALGAAPGVVLSHAFWSRRLGADPAVVGQAVTLNGRPLTVLGVAAPDFVGAYTGLSLDLFVPTSLRGALTGSDDYWEARDYRFLEGLGRLAPGASLESARAALAGAAADWRRLHPEEYRDRGPRLVTRWQSPWGASRFMGPVVLVLGWMALAVLVTAAANVSGLLLARGLKRRRDLALRLALGAERFDLVRLLAAESLLLAIGGGAIGWMASRLALGALFSSFPPMNLPIAPSAEMGLDGLGVGVGLVLLSALASALSPILLVRHASPIDGLRAHSSQVISGGGASSRHRAGRSSLRRVLVGLQVGLGALLLVTAALCQRALSRGLTLPTGFETRSILLAALDLPSQGYDESATRAFLEQVVGRLRDRPEVASAAAARRLPLDIAGITSAEVRVAGSAAEAEGKSSPVRFNSVSPGYFEALGIGLEAGRDFRGADDAQARPVAVVSRAFGARFWPEASPAEMVDRTFRLGDEEHVVVGVAADTKISDLAEAPRPFFYLPLAQSSPGAVFLVIRTHGEPLDALPLLRETVRSIDPNVPLYSVKTMAEHFELGVYKQRLASRSLAVLGGVALVLSVVGLYGLLAYFVALRSREIGLRRALGARAVDVLRLVAGEGMRPVVIGLGGGLLFAVGTSGLLSGLLLGVSPRDPVAFGLSAALFLATAVAALVVPARRAIRLDPATTLRED